MFIVQSFIKRLLEQEKNSSHELNKVLALSTASGFAEVGAHILSGIEVDKKELVAQNELFCKLYYDCVTNPPRFALSKYGFRKELDTCRTKTLGKLALFENFREEQFVKERSGRIQYPDTVAYEVII